MSGKNYRLTRVYDVNIQPDNWEREVYDALIGLTDDDTISMKIEEGVEVATYGYDDGDTTGELTLVMKDTGGFFWVSPDDVDRRNGDQVVYQGLRYAVEMNDDSETIDI